MADFKLISWNILAGGGKRIAAQTAALAELQPDVIALQEVNINTAPMFATQLAAHGYPYTLHSFENLSDRELHRAGGRDVTVFLSPAKRRLNQSP